MSDQDETRGHRVDIHRPAGEQEGAPGAGDEIGEAQDDPLGRLQAELEAERDAHLRSLAELRNYRERLLREQAEERKYALSGVLEALLPTLDHLEMALQAAQEQGEGGTALAEGVGMTYRQMTETLARFGLQAMPAAGEVFDPNRHEAMYSEAVAPGDPAEGTVTAELRRGYMLHERVLRPAQVRVAIAAE